jgi:DNA-binding SARP family transcriptional activator/tetratricopeptide (TPR) repeat protein
MVLEIKLLGPLIIDSIDGRLGKLPKKARGLLAYLAAQREKTVSRDRFADLLWPDRSSEEARHSLRNCLLGLRKTLGKSAAQHLVTDLADCHLRDVHVDLESFERLSCSALRSERRAAAELYCGEFLADLYIPSEPFQEWLAAERERTLNLVCTILQRLTSEEDAACEHDEAIQSARRLVALDPLLETGHRALMRAYAGAGRRPEALRQHRRCAEILKRELGIAPDADTQRLAKEITSWSATLAPVPRSGFYEIPDLRVAVLSDTVEHLFQEQELLATTIPAKPRAQWPCLLPSVAVAVTPLRNLTGDQGRQHVLEALTDDLVTDLLQEGRGLSRARVMDERRALASLPRTIGLDAEFVVTGSAQQNDAGKFRINMQITDAVTAEYRWAGQDEASPEDLESLQTNITRRVSLELRILLLQEVSRRAFAGSELWLSANDSLSSAAKALSGQMRAESTAVAQRWFLAALAEDPRNVEALVGLARTCQHLVSQPWWAHPRAVAVSSDLGREAVSIALSLAPGHAVANCIKGMLCSAAGKLEEAADDFERALTTNPQLGIAHAFAGYNAAFLGHAEDTSQAVERAMRLDQTSRRNSIFLFFVGFSELLLGRTEAAIALLRKSLERNPSYGSAQLFLIAALSLVGRQREAVQTAVSFREQYPGYRSSAIEQLWLSRSASLIYQAQLDPIFEKIQALVL